jgi:very-short-patch-repair endonuclease
MAKPKRSDPDAIWDASFQLAEAYFMEHGHLLIPHSYMCAGRRLGRWIGTQRSDYYKRTNPFFTRECIAKLESIGMVWDVKNAAWEIMCRELENYCRQYGTARVPQSYVTPEGKQLGGWINKQRMDRRCNKIAPERKERLEKLGMIWEAEVLRRGSWDVKLDLLKVYLANHNGKFPAADYITEAGVQLGLWLNNQRQKYRTGTLLLHRKKKLEKLGMVWKALEQYWEEQYGQAKAYYQSHGNLCLFSQRGGQSPKGLGAWLSKQRSDYRRGQLSPERIRKLEKIGMSWEVRENEWEAMYRRALAFYRQHGHLRVSKTRGASEDYQLGYWLGTQRKNYSTGTNPFFTGERTRRLEEIGMVWDASVDPQTVWEEWYGAAEKFFQEHGHLNPPKGRLRTWIHAQRGAKRGKRGCLSSEKVRRLGQIGMVWLPVEEKWNRMYGYAREYYQLHQMLNIPCTYVTEEGERLGQWIAAQRSGYKNWLAGLHGGGRNVITPEHAEQLNRIGMIWDASTLTGRTSYQEKALLYYLKQSCEDADKVSQWQPLGVELDIFLPSLKAAVEYDGLVWHADKAEKDEAKGRICREQGIRLVRIREPGLPEVSECSLTIQLNETGDKALKKGIAQLFDYLELPAPDCDIARDRTRILASYKDYVSQKWNQMYKEVYGYYRRHGNLSVAPDVRSSSGVSVANWINSQREAYRNDELTSLQIQKLEKVGMVWDPFEQKWMRMYHLAEEYSRQQGNLEIPAGYRTEDRVGLGAWLVNQREEYRRGQLDLRRIHLLERLAVIWHPLQRNQDRCLEAAKAYYRKHGNLHVPAQYITKDGLRLGGWLGDQRELYKMKKLGQESVRKLEELGVQWDVFGARWEEMFHVAEEYFLRQGNLWVCSNYVTPEGIHLGEWISQQRDKLTGKDKSRKHTPEQKHRLELIGMVWNPYTVKWQNKYLLAKAYYEEHGHLKIPVEYITETGEKLGMWLASQRQAMRGNPNFLMTEERKRLLEEIGMDWSLKFRKPTARCRQKQTV